MLHILLDIMNRHSYCPLKERPESIHGSRIFQSAHSDISDLAFTLIPAYLIQQQHVLKYDTLILCTYSLRDGQASKSQA
jgi:hypothetical protein